MIQNYFKIALRNLTKQKFYSLINIIGLAIGLATCLLIVAYVLHEVSYDRYHENDDRIYRSTMAFQMGGQHNEFTTSPAPMAGVFIETYPEIEQSVRFRTQGEYTVYYEDQAYKEAEVSFVDSTLFEVFTIPLLMGDPATALTEVNALIINESSAEKYFGADWQQTNPLDETLLIGRDKKPYRITAVYEDFPDNSHMQFTMLLSMVSREESRNEQWLSSNFYTYFLVNEDANLSLLEDKINETFESYAAPQLEAYSNGSYEDFKRAGNYFRVNLQALTDIHLYSDLSGELEANGDIRYVYIFSLVALFVLLIACFNFMNLSTARSSGRAKEVGIRKALGSERKQLISQFLLEALTISMIAMTLALLLTEVALPFFNEIADKHITINYFAQWYYLPIILLVAIGVGILAGSYPAFFLSAFRPASVLKGKLASGAKNSVLRSTLVVLQFGISIVLIIGTLVVFQQLNHMQNRKLGYDREHVLVVHDTYNLNKQIDAFKTELLRNPKVVNATVSGNLPAEPFTSNSSAIFPGKNAQNEYTTSLPWWSVDYDYIPTMGMKIVEGRNFSPEYATDSLAMIINQSAVKQFHLDDNGESPIGKILSSFAERPEGEAQIQSFKVVGVVEDFNFETMRHTISPMVMVLGNDKHWVGRSISAVSLRLQPEDVSQTVAAVEATWNQFLPGIPFEYSFLDDRFNGLYKSEQRVGEIFSVFCGLAIIIACLGLFGLAAYSAEQRTKEIGIRKVLGASVMSVVILFSKDFARLVLISLLLAIPVSYFAMQQWLSDFAYRVPLGIGIFALAGIIALCIALLTVGFQSLKAAVVNPVNSLRSE